MNNNQKIKNELPMFDEDGEIFYVSEIRCEGQTELKYDVYHYKKIATYYLSLEKAIAYVRRNFFYCGDLIESGKIIVLGIDGNVVKEVRYKC